MHNHNNQGSVTLEDILTCYHFIQLKCRLNACGTDFVTKSPNTDPSSIRYSTIDSSITTRTRIQPNHPSSLGYLLSAIQVKFRTMGINFTKQCICTHITSMQHQSVHVIHQFNITESTNQHD